MERCIRILDYIDENEKNWIELSEELKGWVYGGLEEIANFKLTNDVDVPVQGLVSGPAKTWTDGEMLVVGEEIGRKNLHLERARMRFVKSLEIALRIAKIKMRLKEILDDQ
jgi:hypothetical protein